MSPITEKNDKEFGRKDVARKEVNREETCPLLLRVFCNPLRHNNVEDYYKGNTPENEIQIYTWMDASLKELTGLIKEVNPDARRKGTYFDFAVVYPDLRHCNFTSKEIGSTVASLKSTDDNKTLADCKFSIGDYLDVAITPPNQRADRMDYGGRRMGGFGGGFDRFRGGRGGDGRDRMRGDRDRDLREEHRLGGGDRRGEERDSFRDRDDHRAPRGDDRVRDRLGGRERRERSRS